MSNNPLPQTTLELLNHPIHHFYGQRAHHFSDDLKQEICTLGQADLAMGLMKWMYDCQEDLYFQTSIFKNSLGKSNLCFGLEVEAEPMSASLWEEDINAFLDIHAQNKFWSQDLHPKSGWVYLTLLKMETSNARRAPYERNSANSLLRTLNTLNQPILIQSLFHLQWFQPKRGPKPEAFFFDPCMEDSFVPRSRPAPSRKIDHVLAVFSEKPIGTFLKTLILRSVHGRIEGRPIWTTMRCPEGIWKQSNTTDAVYLSPKEFFRAPRIKEHSLRISPTEFEYILTGNLHKKENQHPYCGYC